MNDEYLIKHLDKTIQERILENRVLELEYQIEQYKKALGEPLKISASYELPLSNLIGMDEIRIPIISRINISLNENRYQAYIIGKTKNKNYDVAYAQGGWEQLTYANQISVIDKSFYILHKKLFDEWVKDLGLK